MPIRVFTENDINAVNDLWQSVWWPKRSRAGWRWLMENPVLKDAPAPVGWVLTDAMGVVRGFLGALVQKFWLRDEAHYGLTGHSLVVAPEARGSSRHLLHTLLSEPGFFTCYTLNANALAYRLYWKYGFKPCPVETAELKLSWVLDPLICLEGRLLRWAVSDHPSLARRVGERLLPGKVWKKERVSFENGVRPLHPSDPAYAVFWQAIRAQGRLVADRSPQVQRWRMKDPDLTIPQVMLAYAPEDEVTAYATAIFAKGNSIEPLVLEIIDLVALDDAPEGVPALMEALIKIARAHGAAKVRLSMVNAQLLSQLGEYAQTARREGGWNHAQIIPRQGGPDINLWQPTPYDGDLNISLRPPPKRVA